MQGQWRTHELAHASTTVLKLILLSNPSPFFEDSRTVVGL